MRRGVERVIETEKGRERVGVEAGHGERVGEQEQVGKKEPRGASSFFK